MMICIICYIPVQARYLGKTLSLKYRPKCSMKQPQFLHVDTKSQKLKVDRKFLFGHSKKWVGPIWSWDSKIDCISRMI